MSGLAEHFPEFQTGGGQVSSTDMDRYGIYQIIAPMIGTFSWGTAVGTSTQTPTVAFTQVLADYPRNVQVTILPASGSISGGTLSLVGKNQFGEPISETFSVGTAVNGGTAVGTKVFASFTSAAATIGVSDAGNGTFTIAPAVTGTTTLFGLPTKIAGSADVRLMSFGSTGVAKAVNGGTIGAFVDVATSSIKAPNTLTTAAGNLTWINVWYKTTYHNEGKNSVAAL